MTAPVTDGWERTAKRMLAATSSGRTSLGTGQFSMSQRMTTGPWIGFRRHWLTEARSELWARRLGNGLGDGLEENGEGERFRKDFSLYDIEWLWLVICRVEILEVNNF